MKKRLLIGLLFSMLFAQQNHAQTCPPADITFQTQADINNFYSNYPGCTVIQGNVTINAAGFGGQITNLNGLNGLTSIGGYLFIRNCAQLTNLTGLSTLTSIGGFLAIQDNLALVDLNGLNNLTTVGQDLQIGGSNWQTNAALTNLAGLDNLTTVGGKLFISDNPVLQNVTNLGKLNTVKAVVVYNNQQLNSLAGLVSLNTITQEIVINNNPLLTDLGFLINLSVINGTLEINGNTALASLSALQNITVINNGLKIAASPAIVSLANLSNITSVAGGLTIEDLDGLTDLHGLENINMTNGPFGSYLSILDNALLSSLSGLNPNISAIQSLDISGNASLPSLQGLEGITTAGSIGIANNPVLSSLNGLQNLSTVSTNLILHGNPALQSLNGLSNLTNLGGLGLANNNGLSNLNGLENLVSLGGLGLSGSNSSTFNLSGMTNLASLGNLSVTGTTQLKNLAGLEGIAVSGNIYIEQNTSLENLDGLQGATTINQLYIGQNPALKSLTGLENVKTIFDGVRLFDNPLLTDLNGLSNLQTIRHDFFAYGNQSLSDCSIVGLCLFIDNPPQPDSVAVGNNAPGCNTLDEVSALCLSGYVTVEVTADPSGCFGGLPVADMPIRFSAGVQNTLKPTDANGIAEFRDLGDGPITLTLPLLNDDLWNTCETRQTFVAFDGRDSTRVRLIVSPKVQCPELNVKLNLPTNFRGCLVNSVVQATVQNTGPTPAAGSKLAVVMPPVFDIVQSSRPLTGQNGDTLFVEFGDLQPFEKAELLLTVKTKCDTFLLGQTLCWEAFAAMDNACPPSGQAYSEIKLKAECIGNSIVRLGLKNIGNAPTQGWHEYKIIRNDLLQYNNSFSLNAQQSLSFDFPADGSTWRMEGTKFDDGTQTAVALENCGGLSPGWITAFWLDHGPVEYDFDCRQVVQAYDPNRKYAIPNGAGPWSVISRGQPIFYTIDFQNTGTDTAFRVQLIDLLSDKFDLNTFRPEGASHPCQWTLNGKTLEVLFLPIALPDSNVNQEASKGYFSFSISPKQGLPDGTEFYNYAKIIFDFNWPIWTNGVYLSFGQLSVSVAEPETQPALWKVLGNPTQDRAIFRAGTFIPGEKQFDLFDATGRALRSVRFSEQEFEFRREALPEGVYFFRINDAMRRVFAGKIVVGQ
jgi:uncharacterized repeat protein (TIGR01451 family)